MEYVLLIWDCRILCSLCLCIQRRLLIHLTIGTLEMPGTSWDQLSFSQRTGKAQVRVQSVESYRKYFWFWESFSSISCLNYVENIMSSYIQLPLTITLLGNFKTKWTSLDQNNHQTSTLNRVLIRLYQAA